MMRYFLILLFVMNIAGCSPLGRDAHVDSHSQPTEVTLPASTKDAAAFLLKSTQPSPEVDKALALISQYEDKSMRFEKTIKTTDGSLHIGLQQSFPKLGIVVHHYDQKFTHASKFQ